MLLLDKRFHFANELRFDLMSFAFEHVGLSRNYDAAQLKRRLGPANGCRWAMSFWQPFEQCRGQEPIERSGGWGVASVVP
jgi:hypothetical protein